MRLEIYVSSHCENCQEAYAIADRARSIPGVEVAIVNLDGEHSPPPRAVVAVPTYLLDGRVVSLGNPAPEGFVALLRRQAQERAV